MAYKFGARVAFILALAGQASVLPNCMKWRD